ncbi:glycoside hydrolase family 17-like protein [Phytophthora cinnamomi]|nr:glycoside hydrolase family 17-like protein [Phytophthora cinnamomi]
MMANFGDKLLLTETGWPSSGSVSGNTGSLEGEQTFYSAYQKWSSGLSEKFYFQFFDVPSKAEAYEQSFGLYTADSQPKFTMSQSPSTSSNQQQQPQQQQQQTTSAPTTQAPAPTTPAPTPEPTTATPQSTTPAPETQQSSGSSETNSNYNSTSPIASSSGSHESKQLSSHESKQHGSHESKRYGSASLEGSDKDAGVYSKKSSSSTKQEDSKAEKTSQTSETSHSAQSTVSSIGKSSETEQQTSGTNDGTQKANTQGADKGSGGGFVGLAVGGGVCAVLVAFGFIYQTRKHAEELEDDKDQSFSAMTPVENICSL